MVGGEIKKMAQVFCCWFTKLCFTLGLEMIDYLSLVIFVFNLVRVRMRIRIRVSVRVRITIRARIRFTLGLELRL